MEKIRLEIVALSHSVAPNRPLTHDLFKNSLEKFEIDLKEIVINNLVEGVFYSLLICERHGETIEIDSRTSDAIAMAVRFQCPIYTSEDILEKAGVEIEDGESDQEGEKKPSKKRSRQKPASAKTTTARPDKLSSYSIKDLKSMLDEMLTNENYEKAAEIRDELERREKEG